AIDLRHSTMTLHCGNLLKASANRTRHRSNASITTLFTFGVEDESLARSCVDPVKMERQSLASLLRCANDLHPTSSCGP
ncbi:MAG: hypothetical protein VX757_12260, partial [Planctomycetota bacterium]|nr:hypothetical protein [Planctomycetota bacterium]